MICAPNTGCPENWVHIRPVGGYFAACFPGELGRTAENVILKGGIRRKKVRSPFFCAADCAIL